MVDTPNLGSSAGEAAAWSEEHLTERFMVPYSMLIASIFMPKDAELTKYLAADSAWAIASYGTTGILLEYLNRHARQPIVQEQKPESAFLRELNSLTDVPGTYEAPSYSIIVGRGVPTPTTTDTLKGVIMNSDIFTKMVVTIANTLTDGEMDTYELKIASMNLTLLSGYPFFDEGDMVSSVSSQKGEGIKALEEAKRYEYEFRSNSLVAAYTAADAVITYIYFISPQMSFFAGFGTALAAALVTGVAEDYRDYIFAHTTMKDKIVIDHPTKDAPPGTLFATPAEYDYDAPTMLEQALFDSPLIGATSTSSINSQPFILSTNVTSEGGAIKALSVNREIKIEKMTEGTNPTKPGALIEINGQGKNIEAFTVKEPPTRIEGVLRDFMPKKMQYFQYSENFAAWKDINILDEYGHFIVDGLNLAEGQNVIAFKAKNKVGYTSNQYLTITVNTIPLLPSQFQPAPNSYTKNNQPVWEVVLAKSAYSSSPLENIRVNRVILRNNITGEEWDITAEVEIEESGGPYDKRIKIRWKSKNPLPDGQYTMLAVVDSNVGTTQAMWGATIDTQSPIVAIDPIKPYSPRAPTVIRYTASDPSTSLGTSEAASILGSVRCDLYNQSGNLIKEIATDEGVASGEHYFNWNGAGTPDGTYKVRIKAFDLAGNYTVAETPIIIDSTPPNVISANVTPNPMSSKFDEMKLETGVSEKAQVFIKMTNRNTKSTKVYLINTTPSLISPLVRGRSPEGTEGVYTWSYNNSFLPGPEDGLYDIEIAARDEAGNESVPYKLESIRIDRTPPVVYAQATLPYVLSNSGMNPYSTTLSYRISESNDVASNRISEDQGISGQRIRDQDIRIKIKLYNETDHELATVWDSAPASLAEINRVSWDGNSPDYSKGSYRFQIVAEDDLGNQSISYASCVKDGIAPVISFPSENGAEISGVVAIRGTAIDPDWTNSKPFKQYRVYYKEGRGAPITSPGADWKTEALEVPLSNRAEGSVMSNTGQRPLQNDSTLAYLYTNALSPGPYTLLVVVDEEGGESIATTRVVEVKNDPFAASVPSPYVKLYPVPSDVSFRMDNSTKLPIRFLNSVKPANVHVEMTKGNEVVFYKYFPNLAGAPYIGRPEYRSGSDLGYFIWEDEEGWHVRWSSDGNSHRFSGNLITIGGSITPRPLGEGQGVRATGNVISWDSNNTGGFDFTVANGKQLMITPKIDEDPTSPSPYASNIYLGISKASQEFIPIMIDLENQKMMDLASMASGGSGGVERNGGRSASSGIEWDGKLDTGAFADDGEYLVKVRAEGVDGFGIATDEARVRVVTPFELKKVEAINRNFSPLSAPDRVSVSYNLSKDSLVSAYVFDESNNLISTLLEGERIPGALNPNNKYSLSWRGNYPAPNSATVVTSGRYYLKLIARAVDGAGGKIEEIRDISVVPYYRNESFARLDPLGNDATLNGERIRLAEGESPYYFEAKGSGLYYPPKDFSYTLSATGKQRFTTYPYVPFAALVHRGFNKVKVNAVVTLKVHYRFNDGYRVLEGNIYADGDYEDVKTTRFEFTPSDPLLPDIRKVYPRKHEGRIKKIEARIDVYAADGGYLLDTTEKWFTLPLSADGLLTDKGMFKIAGNEYEQPEAYVWTYEFMSPFGISGKQIQVPTQWPHIANIEVGLASPIQYSRLTNRFIPWVDYVCAKRTVAKDDNFSGYMNRLDKLGFPGNTYFNGPSTVAKSADAPHKDSYDAGLFPGSASSLAEKIAGGFARPKAGEIYSKTDTRFSSDSATDYTAYLSDEYLEFIPITAPENGYYEFSDGTKITDSVKRYEGYKDPSSFNAKAVTPVKMVQSPPAGESQTPFIFAWPGPDISSWNLKYGTGGENYRKLVKSAGGDPQKYDGFGSLANICYYELDQNEITAHAGEAQGSIDLSGKTLLDKNSKRSVWSSGKSIGELLEVKNYVEDLAYSISSSAANLEISLTSAGRSGYVQAEDTNSPLNWSTEQDTNLSENRGFIKSDFRLFNDEDFRGKRTLKIAEPYRISEDYLSVPALKYTFLKYNPFSADGKTPIDNPNVVLNSWDISVKDRKGL
ncbi:Ig-like domain repeat protein [Candidatus Saganbacteria bacterium]|nr:Ig-like domain repeat protein [Candidatus Saganbacteria bacterium]